MQVSDVNTQHTTGMSQVKTSKLMFLHRMA